MKFTVISIGTLSHNRLWGEGTAVRTAHATTTLVADENRMILVDPSLPRSALAARFNERTGKDISSVTDVFCTTLRPVHRRSIEAFPKARWWVSERELEAYGKHLEALLDSAERLSAPEDSPGELGENEARLIRKDLDLVRSFHPAPDKLTAQVGLYPLVGASVGSAGLVLTTPTSTAIIAGDAALTREHLQRGQIWEGSADTEAALESLQDILEIADVIVPGHDNVVFSPQRNVF